MSLEIGFSGECLYICGNWFASILVGLTGFCRGWPEGVDLPGSLSEQPALIKLVQTCSGMPVSNSSRYTPGQALLNFGLRASAFFLAHSLPNIKSKLLNSKGRKFSGTAKTNSPRTDQDIASRLYNESKAILNSIVLVAMWELWYYTATNLTIDLPWALGRN